MMKNFKILKNIKFLVYYIGNIDDERFIISSIFLKVFGYDADINWSSCQYLQS